MKEKVITDNMEEKIIVKWDGNRFALVQQTGGELTNQIKAIILSPREMMEIVQFAGNLGVEQC